MSLYYERSGRRDAVPVVLLRPIAGTGDLWGAFRDALAQRFAVIACEHRGVGRSPPAVPTTTRGMARDVADLLDVLGHTRVHVFGLSLGGMVATWLATDRPERVDRLVLASTPSRGLDLLHAARHGPRYAGCLLRASGDREACLVARVLSPAFVQAQPERARAIIAAVRGEGGSLRSLLLHAAAGAAHDARRSLGKVVAPTLCIAGELDQIVGEPAMRRLATMLPNASLEVMPATGHDLSLEQPLELAMLVTRFLDA
ncbi:MAG: alpha/beta fold hydrolase [Deltaproteobacteria bacterium]|nr:alpha/beta fold hydrolase [Deltaproteobacteria bacterium]